MPAQAQKQGGEETLLPRPQLAEGFSWLTLQLILLVIAGQGQAGGRIR
jgi:hypothetical protein